MTGKNLLILIIVLCAGALLLTLTIGPAVAEEAPATQPAATSQPSETTTGPQTDMQKACYAIGMDIAGSLKESGIDLDVELLLAGLRDTLEGKPTVLTPEQAQQALTKLQQIMMAKHMATMKEAAEKGLAEGAAFLEKNKAVEGVKTTDSGLQYQVIKEGDGASPKATDTVKVHYRGTLLDGTEFDSSYSRNQPAQFPLNRVIEGWSEGLQLMKTGGKYKLFVPSGLGYKEQGSGKDIPPNATLIFEVELLEVLPAAAP